MIFKTCMKAKVMQIRWWHYDAIKGNNQADNSWDNWEKIIGFERQKIIDLLNTIMYSSLINTFYFNQLLVKTKSSMGDLCF